MVKNSSKRPENLRQGAWKTDGGKVYFAFWAPGKKSISVVGNFNDWNKKADQMTSGDDGVWWIEKTLDPGLYEYGYIIDQETYVCDPYAREVNWTDKGVHTLLRIEETLFPWEDEDFEMPTEDDMIVYEVHVGDFTDEGTFQGMIKYLDYIKELGVNVVELMPVFEFPGDFSWGYNPAYTMAVESSYGSLNDFKTLVNETHKRGMAIILDIVFNHVDGEHPFNKMYDFDKNPFFNGDINEWGFPDLDHSSDAVKSYIHQIQQYWLEDCHVDGFRYDAAKDIGYDEMHGVTFMTWDARNIQPHVFLIAEHVPEDPSLLRISETDALWHRSWHQTMFALLTEHEYEGFSPDDTEQLHRFLDLENQGYQDFREVINFLEGHDWERIIHEVQKHDGLGQAALQKSVLGTALLFTLPGIPMVYYGQEVATNIPREKTMEAGHRPDWGEAFDDEGVQWLFECYKRLAWLRREAGALKTGNIETRVLDPESKVLIFKRWGDDGSEIIVLANFSGQEREFGLELHKGGKYHEVLTGEDWELGQGDHHSTLPHYTARVLKRIGDI